jgi:hypothetical protein
MARANAPGSGRWPRRLLVGGSLVAALAVGADRLGDNGNAPSTSGAGPTPTRTAIVPATATSAPKARTQPPRATATARRVAAPTRTPEEARTAACDPSYPTVCIPPPPPDLDCKDVPYRRFPVAGLDPHGFDRDGDGVGCEA